MDATFINSIHDVSPADWDALWPDDDYPFSRHSFLAALEESGCTRATSGWQPHHLLLRQQGQVVAVVPLYLKTHSWGEYVFDWSWADAWQRNGLNYYPKLVNAIPFTPATGPRFAIAGHLDRSECLTHIAECLSRQTHSLQASSWHSLFLPESDSLTLDEVGIPVRLGCQFHWFNRGFGEFDDFLGLFSSRKRKNLKRERRQVAEQAVTLQRYTGQQIPESAWQAFYRFYQATYLKRSGNTGYLNQGFFMRIAAKCEQLMMVVAYQHERIVATALYWFDRDTLYGRFWGTLADIPGLHFEACYYQGIEFAIERGLQRFDPGAQGEHKIQRGFVPVITRSNHWIEQPQLRAAVSDFLRRESPGILAYRDDCRRYLPFREGVDIEPR